jgi:hypothetical protein
MGIEIFVVILFELIWIYSYEYIVLIVRLSGSAAVCGSAALCGRAAVCGSAVSSLWQCAGNVHTVCAIVWGSALGSVHIAVRAAVCSGPAVQQCAAVRQCGSVRLCGSVWQCERQSVAVRTVVCSSAAVCGSAAVYSSVCGSVQQCVHSARGIVCAQCARQCATVRLVGDYGSVRGSVQLCARAAVSGNAPNRVRQCVAVCGGLWQCCEEPTQRTVPWPWNRQTEYSLLCTEI